MTTFIKTELIADGHGRANVPRVGGKRNGIQNGRKIDDEIRRWIENGMKHPLKLPGSRRIAAGLHHLGIRPLKAQMRVTHADLMLTTLIDIVGESSDGSNTLWVCEVKATTLKTENHNPSYRRQCRRTPMMRNGLPHTEQATHFLQAAFGAMALRRCYALPSELNVKACVLVATADACRTYVCPTSFFKLSLYKRRAAVPITSNKKALASRPTASRRSTCAVRWPGRTTAAGKALEAVLHRVGLVPKPQARGVLPAVRQVQQKRLGPQSPPIGVVLLVNVPLHRIDPRVRKVLTSKLEKSAKALLKTWPMVKAAARLVLCTSTKTLVPCPGPLARP